MVCWLYLQQNGGQSGRREAAVRLSITRRPSRSSIACRLHARIEQSSLHAPRWDSPAHPPVKHHHPVDLRQVGGALGQRGQLVAKAVQPWVGGTNACACVCALRVHALMCRRAISAATGCSGRHALGRRAGARRTARPAHQRRHAITPVSHVEGIWPGQKWWQQQVIGQARALERMRVRCRQQHTPSTTRPARAARVRRQRIAVCMRALLAGARGPPRSHSTACSSWCGCRAPRKCAPAGTQQQKRAVERSHTK